MAVLSKSIEKVSFPGSAWERAAREAPPRLSRISVGLLRLHFGRTVGRGVSVLRESCQHCLLSGVSLSKA